MRWANATTHPTYTKTPGGLVAISEIARILVRWANPTTHTTYTKTPGGLVAISEIASEGRSPVLFCCLDRNIGQSKLSMPTLIDM